MLWLQREQMEHAQMFAVIQTLVEKDKAKEAFEDYKKIRFPWIESSKEKDKGEHIKKLLKEVKGGALVVTEQQGPTRARSNLHTRIIERTPEGVKKIQSKIYSKMGNMVPR